MNIEISQENLNRFRYLLATLFVVASFLNLPIQFMDGSGNVIKQPFLISEECAEEIQGPPALVSDSCINEIKEVENKTRYIVRVIIRDRGST